MSVKEIKTAIMNLPIAEVDELVTWLDEYYASLWDQEIEDDVNAGRFDALLAEIDEEYAIQRGKYAHFLTAGDLLPSEAFAASKAEEKAREERRWLR